MHDESVPVDIKQKIPGIVKEPSVFIKKFLKEDRKFIEETLRIIYNGSVRSKFDRSSKRYAKKLKECEDDYNELIGHNLKMEFNKEDMLKNAFLQYMLYAYCMRSNKEFENKQ